jgi:nickel-dependent lactate racemase
MRIAIRHGRHDLDLDLGGRCLGALTGQPPVDDPSAAVREALESPVNYPALRRALTPGDHVAVLLDEGLPDVASLLVPLLDHVASAGVEAGSVTVVCPTTTSQDWVEQLPDRHEDVHVEVHDPKDRRRLSYLATTGAGRRLYLNRAAVDADQLVVLSERRYDLRLGYGGAEGAIFPALADEPTLKEVAALVRTDVPGNEPWPLRQEAIEVSWLLGQPFYVLAVASRGSGVAHVVAGAEDACKESIRLLDQGWKPRLARRPDVVLVTFSGEAQALSFADLAGAAFNASRVVGPSGRVVLVADAAPDLGAGGDVLLRSDEPHLAVAALTKAALPGSTAALLWAQAAAASRLSLLGGFPDEVAEELFATPLSDEQLPRLVASGDVLVLEDAQRMMPVVE